jgi:four helix bundle protein
MTDKIAEGFSRKVSKEKAQILYVSLGSVTESQNQLLIAKDLCYLFPQDLKDFIQVTVKIDKLISDLSKSSKILIHIS